MSTIIDNDVMVMAVDRSKLVEDKEMVCDYCKIYNVIGDYFWKGTKVEWVSEVDGDIVGKKISLMDENSDVIDVILEM